MTSRTIATLLLVLSVTFGACGRLSVRQYEYDEDLHLALDGSATLFVNGSVPALVALRGLPLDTRPNARLDRQVIRRAYTGPGVRVTRVSLSRRAGRRFVHIRMELDDVRAVSSVPPLAWSTIRFDRTGDEVAFRQRVADATGPDVAGVGWTGAELVAFRLHLPSEIRFHNAPSGIERGNILVWEQTLGNRRVSVPLDMQVRMASTSILARTLLLFAASGAAAVVVVAGFIWWAVRKKA